MREEFLWVEKYRPKTVSECILPRPLKKTFTEFVKNKEIPNLLLHGSAGVGKTTIARALCEELGTDYIMINGSDERNIDTLRTTVKGFASTVSFSGGRKIVIIDEADYLNPTSTQPALRAFMEEFSQNCGFIFTCNYPMKMIPALHSRCSVIGFVIEKNQQQYICADFLNRVRDILNTEGISYNTDVVAELIIKFLPDWRRVLNELQRYSSGGDIDVGILSKVVDEKFDVLVDILVRKNITDIREWVVNNLDTDPASIYRRLYDNLYYKIEPNTVPEVITCIGDFSYRSAFVADQEINLVCCLIELINKCVFL
jgi:DNA polymerase III delta prime subunit